MLFNLLRCAKIRINFPGNDENARIIDDSAIYLLRFFLDVNMVLIRHITELKTIFGTMSSQQANKVCSVVTELRELFDEKIMEFIRQSVANGNHTTDSERKSKWNRNIKWILPEEPVPKSEIDRLQSFEMKKITGTSISNTFSMRYDKSEAKNSHPNVQLNRAWLLTHVSNEVVESLISVLKSKKSNEELQNELIELLGFDKFDVLETILEKRKEILKNIDQEDKFNKLMERAAFIDHQSKPIQPVVSSQVVVQSEKEMHLMKQVRKDEKKLQKIAQQNASEMDEELIDESCDAIAGRIKLQQQQQLLDAIRKQPILSKPRKVSEIFSWLHQAPKKVNYPFVFDSQNEARTHIGFIAGSKLILPESAVRSDNKTYEEITLPINMAPANLGVGEERIEISDLDEIGKLAFKGVKELNRIQSVVFERAYHSNDNLLICAPTGAGKTNVAMLTVVNIIRSFTDQGVIHRDQFKIVYVAPMKALAAEMVENFGKRLSPLGKTFSI